MQLLQSALIRGKLLNLARPSHILIRIWLVSNIGGDISKLRENPKLIKDKLVNIYKHASRRFKKMQKMFC